MTSRCYFGKMNSILGSVVPLAMVLEKDQWKRSRVAGDDEGVAEGSLQAQLGELGQNNSFHLRFTATTKKHLFLSVS